ncbi:MAG TPA: sulfatase [Acidobacteriota bacterium]|nr:sulfatase [Acidobacteriota bacterium]
MTRTTRRDFTKLVSLGLPLAAWQAQNLEAGIDSKSPQRPHVLILVFDTLSASHMSLYGYPRKTTPNLERFARGATTYEAHYAGGNFTTPGTASLLTGALPWSHRAFNHAGRLSTPFANRNIFSAFREAGYRTLAYTHNMLACYLLYQCRRNIDQLLDPGAFCLYDGNLAPRFLSRDADTVTRAFEDFLLQRGEIPGSLFFSLVDRVRMRALRSREIKKHLRDYPRGVPELFKLTFRLEDAIEGIKQTIGRISAPTFAYFHLLPPHEPYRPHRDFVGIFQDRLRIAPKPPSPFSAGVDARELQNLRTQYDEFLTYTDAHIGRLMDFLEASGRFDDTIIVFTSDHGQLFERGIHGHVTEVLYDPIIRVPLIIRTPGGTAGQRVSRPTSCIDVLPTVLQLAGLKIPEWCEGSSLHGQLETDDSNAVFAMEAKQNPKDAPLKRASFMIRKGNHKLVCYRGLQGAEETYELYDLRNDPEEREARTADRGTLTELRAELELEIGKHDRVRT